jgi:hypothetical protein
MDDPAVQEQIRRGHHEYVAGDGKHGMYVPKQYNREKNEYPKMMGKDPMPQLKDFTKTEAGLAIPQDVALANWQAAVVEWDRYMTSTTVHSKSEEAQWLKENAH